MRKIFKIVVGFSICCLALILPYRLRIIFSDLMGKFLNFFYGCYLKLLNYIIKEIRE